MISASGPVLAKDGTPTVMDQITQLIMARFAWGVPTRGLTADTRLRDDLDLDSLHVVEFQVAIEDHFQVRFDPSDEGLLDAFVTVGSLEAYTRYLLEKGK